MKNRICKLWSKLSRRVDLDKLTTVMGTSVHLHLPETSSMVANSQKSIFTYHTLQREEDKSGTNSACWTLYEHMGGTDMWDTRVTACETDLTLRTGIRSLRKRTNETIKKYQRLARSPRDLHFWDPVTGLKEVEKELRRQSNSQPGLIKKALGCA